MNRFELWDKVARCRLQQHFRLLVALCAIPPCLSQTGKGKEEEWRKVHSTVQRFWGPMPFLSTTSAKDIHWDLILSSTINRLLREGTSFSQTVVPCIGVIYGGTRGTGTPTFQDTGTRGDLQRLNYTRTVFGRGSALDLAREFTFRLCVQGLHLLPSWIGTPTF